MPVAAQTTAPAASSKASIPLISLAQDSLPTVYLSLGVGGFIPLREGYRINYSTSTAGLPVEIVGALAFPVTQNVLTPLTIRYLRREANFIDNTDLSVLRLEPGVRYYVEKYVPNELRVFIGANAILSRATFTSSIETSETGTVTGGQTVHKDYYNLGLGVELGLTYPIGRTQALDLVTNVGMLFADGVSHGGLGNIGGVSIGLAYRLGF